MSVRKQIIWLLFLFLLPGIISATKFMAKDGMIVSRSDIVEDDLYLFGNYAEVYGKVDGDIAAFCYDIKIEGDIVGNVDVFAYNVDLAGDIGKTCHLFGYKVDVSGHIGRNFFAFGRTIDIDNDAIIERDIFCTGEKIFVDGTVKGRAKIAGDIVTISGTVEGDLEIEGKEISIIAPAVIKGDFLYTSGEEAYIDNDVLIEGETDWTLPKKGDAEKDKDEGISAFHIGFKFLLFIMAFITGLALIILFKNHTHESSVQIQQRFWYTLAIGFLALIIFTGGALILLVLIVGIPLSILLVSVGMVLFYVGKLYVSIVLGRLIFGLLAKEKKVALGWELLVGLIVLSLLFQIPVLGTIVYLLAFILGTGGAISGYYSLSRNYNKENTPVSSS